MVNLILSRPEAGELLCALDALLVEIESEIAAAPPGPASRQLDDALHKLRDVRSRLDAALAVPRLHAAC